MDFGTGKGSAWPIRPIPTTRVWHGLLGRPTWPRGAVMASGDGVARDPRGSEVVEGDGVRGDGGPGLRRARRGGSAVVRRRRAGSGGVVGGAASRTERRT